MTLIPFAVFVLFAFVQHFEVMLGLIDLTESNWLTAFNLGGCAGFYILVRSGLSERLARDPFLTLPQILFPICSITWSYAITGPARGAVIAIMVVTIVFGMFALDPKMAPRLAFLAFTALASVMAWRGATAPERYPPEVEIVHALFAAIVMGATAMVVFRIGRLRARLAEQKRELAEALALNQELATRDPLTGLLNRRAMVEMLAREHARSVRGHGPLSIALLDIDWFKRVNDSLGHGVGDEVLRRFATVVQSKLRTIDVLARWGGEEFLLVMPGTSLDDSLIVLERLRAAIARCGFDVIAPALAITFSTGLVQLHPCEAQDAAIDRADRALYRAKKAGRDRVEAA
ncbi:MAG: GGDEF domain-containing protein [Vitreoscilla sp.]|nr:GGDEF domain-containing protein [Vitreoscilla sp.]